MNNKKAKITETQVYGFESAIRGSRNPMDSWHLSDSCICSSYKGLCEDCKLYNEEEETCEEKYGENPYILGEKDLGLAQKLIKAGNEHAKFMRMIQVWADINLPRYFWSEFDTYKFNSKNSCSTMHKLLNKKHEITLDMFEYSEEDKDIVESIIKRLNEIREQFLQSNGEQQRILKRRAKQLLPEGMLQLRTINTNYAELRNMVLQRLHHQLKEEWQEVFCKWVTELPYAKELIFCGIEDEYERLKSL